MATTSESVIAQLNAMTSEDRTSGNYPVIVSNANLAAKRKVYASADSQFMVAGDVGSPCLVSGAHVDSNYHVYDGNPAPSECVEQGAIVSHDSGNGTAYVYTVTAVSGDGILASVACTEELNIFADPHETVDPSNEVGKLDIIKLEVLNIVNSGWSVLTPETVVGG